MYLHDHSKEQVAGDAPICSLDRLVSVADFKKNFKRGDTPPLVEEYSTSKALITDMSEDRINIIWSQDDRSVAVFIDNKPFAMIVNGQNRGFSKALSSQGPWGNPWDDKIFSTAFGEQPH